MRFPKTRELHHVALCKRPYPIHWTTKAALPAVYIHSFQAFSLFPANIRSQSRNGYDHGYVSNIHYLSAQSESLLAKERQCSHLKRSSDTPLETPAHFYRMKPPLRALLLPTPHGVFSRLPLLYDQMDIAKFMPQITMLNRFLICFK